MMKIDNIDIKSTYKIDVADSSLSGLLCYPKAKGVTITDYPDEDGVRADLTERMFLDAYSATLTFNIFAGADIQGFASMLLASVVHTIQLGSIISAKGHLTGYNDTKIINGQGTIRVTFLFSDDYFAGFSYSTTKIDTSAVDVPDYNYTLDGKSLASYGLIPTMSSALAVVRPHDAKTPLVIKSNFNDGQKIDEGATLHLKAKNIGLDLMGRYKGDDIYAYRAFLYDLTREGERTLVAEGKTMKMWYNSASVRAVYCSEDEIAIIFNVNITVNKTN